MKKPLVPEWLSSALLLVGAAGVAFLIFSLVFENRDLKVEISELRAAAASAANMMSVDDVIPATLLSDMAGGTAQLSDLVGHGGVIAFLTTTCPYCEQTLPQWGDIAALSQERGVPFVAVSLHDATLTAAYAKGQGVEWPLWVVDELADATELGVSSVPFTVLVGADGEVSRVWLGALRDADSAAVMAAAEQELAVTEE